MRLAVLFSGGKDSTYAALLAKRAGHELSYLVTVESADQDSFMWHTAAIDLTSFQERASGIPQILVKTAGRKDSEIDELKIVLGDLGIEGVVVGVVASEYQRSRVEKVCKELKLKMFAPLWGKEPEKLLREMITEGFEIIFTSVSADGLGKEWLGRKLDHKAVDELVELNKERGINVSGEGGEYETAVLACPLFKKRIEVKSVVEWKGDCGRLKIVKASLI